MKENKNTLNGSSPQVVWIDEGAAYKQSKNKFQIFLEKIGKFIQSILVLLFTSVEYFIFGVVALYATWLFVEWLFYSLIELFLGMKT